MFYFVWLVFCWKIAILWLFQNCSQKWATPLLHVYWIRCGVMLLQFGKNFIYCCAILDLLSRKTVVHFWRHVPFSANVWNIDTICLEIFLHNRKDQWLRISFTFVFKTKLQLRKFFLYFWLYIFASEKYGMLIFLSCCLVRVHKTYLLLLIYLIEFVEKLMKIILAITRKTIFWNLVVKRTSHFIHIYC